MEPAAYNAFADMLAKFHTSSEWIKTLWLLAVPATIVGITWCVADVAKTAIAALAGGRERRPSRQRPPTLVDGFTQEWPARLPGRVDEWEIAPVGARDGEGRG